MKRSSLAAVFGSMAIALCGAVAQAQTDNNTTPPSTPPTPASVPASDQANTQATTATATADAKLAAIRDRAAATPEKDAKKVDTKLEATKSTVDKEASTKGDATVAGRLATDFGTTADALTAEKAQYHTGWGDLMIAHSLMANSKDGVTLDQLFQMRTSGMGWGQIANGMGLKLGDVISAVASEGKVATGKSKSNGHAATIHMASAGHAHGGEAAAAHTGMGAAASGMHGHSGK